RGRREDRRIGQHEAVIVKIVARGADDLGAYAQDGALTRRPHPEMTVFHQEVNAVLFARDGKRIVFWNALHDPHIGDIKLIAAGRALVGANFAGDDYAGFVCKRVESVKDLGRDLVLGRHALDDAGAVAKNGEDQLAALTFVVEPA